MRDKFDADTNSPCFYDETNGMAYECLRVVDPATGDLIELIMFPGSFGQFGFAYIWKEDKIVIGSLEADIYLKDRKDKLIW